MLPPRMLLVPFRFSVDPHCTIIQANNISSFSLSIYREYARNNSTTSGKISATLTRESSQKTFKLSVLVDPALFIYQGIVIFLADQLIMVPLLQLSMSLMISGERALWLYLRTT